MYRLLRSILNVNPKEQATVALLLAKGFFMGIFIAYFKVSSETLFLQNLGESYLSLALSASGLLGIIGTSIFAFFQGRVSFKILSLGNLMVIFIIAVLARILLGFYNDEIISFFLFVLIGPLQALLYLGFWGAFGRLFDLRQSKRIIGGIDTGQLLATILAYFTIPFLTSFLPAITDLYIIAAGGVILSFLFLSIISTKYNLDIYQVVKEEVSSETRFVSLMQNSYVRFLSLFLLFSMVASYFVDFSFLAVTERQYPQERDLASFLGVFNGAIMILSFLIQTFVNDRIIGTYGLRVSMLILPILLSVFTLASIFTGNLFGTVATNYGFVWFFLSIALSKLFTSSLRDALENPAFKLYFMPLDTRVRFDIQTKVEGIVGEFSRLVAGGVILALSLLSFFELIHYSYFLVLIIIGWVFITYRLYEEYRLNIKKKLETQKQQSEKIHDDEAQLKSMLINNFKSENVGKVIFSIKMLRKMDSELLQKNAALLLKHSRAEVRKFSFDVLQLSSGKKKRQMASNRVFRLDDEKAGADLLQFISNSQQQDDEADFVKSRLREMVRSRDPLVRKEAAELLSEYNHPEAINLLIELLRDLNGSVRLAAIQAAGQLWQPAFVIPLSDNLADPHFSDTTVTALVNYGHNAFPLLEKVFHKTNQHVEVLLNIVDIFGRVGGSEAVKLLWDKVDYPDRKVASQVLLSLGRCGFSADGYQVTRIKNAIEADIADVSWNYAALYEIPDGEGKEQLQEAIREEIENDRDHIFMLLSMIFDPHSIQLIRDNLESRTSEGVTYALELLDVFLTEDYRERIVPILDDLTDEDRIFKLQQFYPRDSLGPTDVLRHIINRDFNQMNNWTKACALYLAGNRKDRDLLMSIVACLFHPEMVLKEAAAYALHAIDEDLYEEHVARLEAETKFMLDHKIASKDFARRKGRQSLLILERVRFLKKVSMFKDFPGNMLARLTENMEEVYLPAGEQMFFEQNDLLHFIVSGVVDVYKNHRILNSLRSPDYIGEIYISENEKNRIRLHAISDTVFLTLEKVKFYTILSSEIKLGKKVISYVSDNKTFENSDKLEVF